MEFHRLSRPLRIEGLGVHAAQNSCVTLVPLDPFMGPHINGVRLNPSRVVDASFATTITTPRGNVATVEHLLAALAGCGVFDVDIHVDGAEVPILDGSAQEWFLMVQKSLTPMGRRPDVLAPTRGFTVGDDERFITLEPSDELSLDVVIEFDALGRWAVGGPIQTFRDFMGARTFGFFSDYETLKTQGYAKGASLKNTLVLDSHGRAVNPSHWMPGEEAARHKWLDLLGDLMVLGCPLIGSIHACRPGHALNQSFVRRLYEQAFHSTPT